MALLSQLLERFHLHLSVERSLSPHTVRNYLLDLVALERHLVAKGLELLTAGTADIEEHLVGLAERLAPASRARHVSSIKRFYRFLVREQLLPTSPARRARRPTVARYVPREVPTEREVFRVLVQPTRYTVLGLRDRAMLELLYGAGLRVAELAGMDLLSVDVSGRSLRVMGKGGRERLCPINAHALRVLQKYLDRRHKLASSQAPQHSTALFLGEWGRRLSTNQILARVKRAAAQAGLELSPHAFRHAFATHLLHRGARVEDVQELLGHADLGATQRYTHLSEAFIRREYQAHHPRAAPSSGTRSSASPSGAPRTPSARTRSSAPRPARHRVDPARTARSSAPATPSLAVSRARRADLSG